MKPRSRSRTEYGAYADPYLAQRQQYQYYEQLRLTNPAAYMALFVQSKQLLAGHAPQDYRAALQHTPLYGDGEWRQHLGLKNRYMFKDLFNIH